MEAVAVGFGFLKTDSDPSLEVVKLWHGFKRASRICENVLAVHVACKRCAALVEVKLSPTPVWCIRACSTH